MSTAPNGFETPKTNWQAADVVSKDDFNRIEGNIQELENTKETPEGAQTKVDTAEANIKGLIGTLSNLVTTAKNNIVAAINEIHSWVGQLDSNFDAHKAEKASETLGHVLKSEIENTWRKIEKITLSVDTTQVDISIPTEYNEIRIVAFNLLSSGVAGMMYCKINNDINANYFTGPSSSGGPFSIGSTAILGAKTDGIKGQCDIHMINKVGADSTMIEVLAKVGNGLTKHLVVWRNIQKINLLSLYTTGYKIALGSTFEVWGR